MLAFEGTVLSKGIGTGVWIKLLLQCTEDLCVCEINRWIWEEKSIVLSFIPCYLDLDMINNIEQKTLCIKPASFLNELKYWNRVVSTKVDGSKHRKNLGLTPTEWSFRVSGVRSGVSRVSDLWQVRGKAVTFFLPKKKREERMTREQWWLRLL